MTTLSDPQPCKALKKHAQKPAVLLMATEIAVVRTKSADGSTSGPNFRLAA